MVTTSERKCLSKSCAQERQKIKNLRLVCKCLKYFFLLHVDSVIFYHHIYFYSWKVMKQDRKKDKITHLTVKSNHVSNNVRHARLRFMRELTNRNRPDNRY